MEFIQDAGSAAVTLKVSERTVEILVEDHGPGIPESESERVFCRFTGWNSLVIWKQAGSGLACRLRGLLPNAHGDDVVLSANNPGLRAAIVLPRG